MFQLLIQLLDRDSAVVESGPQSFSVTVQSFISTVLLAVCQGPPSMKASRGEDKGTDGGSAGVCVRAVNIGCGVPFAPHVSILAEVSRLP